VVLNRHPVPILKRRPEMPPNLARALDDALIDNPVILHQSAASLRKSLVEASLKDGLPLEIDPL
jgi:hypothetical protein